MKDRVLTFRPMTKNDLNLISRPLSNTSQPGVAYALHVFVDVCVYCLHFSQLFDRNNSAVDATLLDPKMKP